MKNRQLKSQQGYFLMVAIIFIFAMGAMGTLIAYIFANRSALSVSEQQGLKVFYNAESGLEIITRLLMQPNLTGTPSRITCAAVTSNANTTNASLNGGTFTVTSINSSPVFSTDTLNGALTSSATTVNVVSSAGFAPSGRIIIDNEAMDYTAISGNSFVNVTRGTDNTAASSHASGAGVGQYQCSVDSQAGIPSIASPSYKRELQWNVELQEAWLGAVLTGNTFVFSHWNRPTEKTWTSTTVKDATNKSNLNGVSMLSNADGWAAANTVGTNFIFLHWAGSTWAVSTLAGACSAQHLLSISMVSSSDGYAVGVPYRLTTCTTGNYTYTILRWNGTSWSKVAGLYNNATAANVPNLNSVSVIDTNGDGVGNFGFAVGNTGNILQYNGTTWTRSQIGGTNPNLLGVYTVSANEAWIVGAGGVIYKWNGSAWSSFTSPTTQALNGITMLDSNGDGLAEFGVAAGNSAVVLTYNGSSWSLTDLGSNNLFGVGIADANDAWAGGAAGTLYHWNGSTWTSVTSGVTTQINSISMTAARNNPTSVWEQIFH